ncbi:hypothetical protein T484DRAFT_1882301 [Baffinella frigidus]|nr:hypothetical protein T484DRAFT_1882301 [Cryptophyta sp. CCMP2293]
MLRSQLVTAAALAILLFSCVCVERTSGIPVSAKSGDAPHEPATRELVIAVKSKASKEALDKAFEDVSANKREQFSLEEICSEFGGSLEAVEAVKTWAEEHGGEASATACSDFVTVRIREDRVLKALGGKLGVVPPSLAPYVDFVDGFGGLSSSLGRYPNNKPKATRNYNPQARRAAAGASQRKTAGDSAGSKGKEPWYPDCMKMSVSPACLREAYNVTSGAELRTSQAVALFGGQFYSSADLAQFWKQFKVPPQKVVNQNDNKENEAGNEASLDVQYITGIAAGSGGEPTSAASRPR